MAQVTIRVNGYTYIVGCEDGQEAHLERMATEIEERVNKIKAIGGQSGEARLLLLAALLLADELHDARTTLPAPPPPVAATDPKKLARLREIAARAEEIAADLTDA
ncbi:MAG: cell division protein ZapA [Acidocella sp. 20-63-7]|nr:MAG: cell division protein ZapA [Acidocella sp. 20-63-7]HQT46605.1 cell division protein ZapA [Acidocella sp.]